MDLWRYPVNWRVISRRIRERDGHRCRWCGAGDQLFHPETGKPVRLTTMHLDGNSWNCEEWNLATACRSCHAAYDAPEVTAARAAARRWRLIDAGQLELFPFQV
jgi:5-methylcytosine-specific restriction endonuclease McrA